MEFQVVSGVKCENCGKLHNLDEKTFIAFHGNVTVGKDGGIYGNKENTKVSVFCKNKTCMSVLMTEIDTKTLDIKDIKQNSEIRLYDNTKDNTHIKSSENVTEELKTEENVNIKQTKNKSSGMTAFDPNTFK